MRDASYKVMNQYYSTKYHNSKSNSTAVKDAIKGGIIGALEGSLGDGVKEIPDYVEYCVNRQAWRHRGTLIGMGISALINFGAEKWKDETYGR